MSKHLSFLLFYLNVSAFEHLIEHGQHEIHERSYSFDNKIFFSSYARLADCKTNFRYSPACLVLKSHTQQI